MSEEKKTVSEAITDTGASEPFMCNMVPCKVCGNERPCTILKRVPVEGTTEIEIRVMGHCEDCEQETTPVVWNGTDMVERLNEARAIWDKEQA